CKGEKTAGIPYDYGKIVYSLDSITFHQINGTPDLVDSTNMTYMWANLPYFLWNRKFYIGFYWENDNAAGNDPPFAVDDITITGRRWMPSMIHTTVDTAGGYDEKPLGPLQTVDFYDKVSGNILATIQDLGGHNWGCVKVEVDRSGTGAQWITGDPQTFMQTKLFDKTYKVTPSNNNSNGAYSITFYLTQAEIAGWMLASGAPLGIARVIKYSDRINNMTYTSTFEQGMATKTAYLGGADQLITAQFNTGFSGFGFGFIPTSTLPVQLISFTGIENNGTVELKWKVEAEGNLAYYIIQRSEDGVSFQDIGKIDAVGGNGTLLYDFTDKAPLKGKSFYRLSMHDRDGSQKISNVVVITIANTTYYKVSPNPFHDKLHVTFGNSSGHVVNARLTDVSGKTVSQKNSIAVSGSALEFELSSLPAGIYILRLFDGREIQVFKVIKK